MQHHGAVSTIAYHPNMDLASAFFSQNYDLRTHGFGTLDMVCRPYSCSGGDATVAGSMPAVATAASLGDRGDERKRRRLASNRESARRSRVRKQRRLDEMSSRAGQLRDANQRLLMELNRVIAEHAHMVRENARLREEASELQEKLSKMEVEDAETASKTSEEQA